MFSTAVDVTRLAVRFQSPAAHHTRTVLGARQLLQKATAHHTTCNRSSTVTSNGYHSLDELLSELDSHHKRLSFTTRLAIRARQLLQSAAIHHAAHNQSLTAVSKFCRSPHEVQSELHIHFKKLLLTTHGLHFGPGYLVVLPFTTRVTIRALQLFRTPPLTTRTACAEDLDASKSYRNTVCKYELDSHLEVPPPLKPPKICHSRHFFNRARLVEFDILQSLSPLLLRLACNQSSAFFSHSRHFYCAWIAIRLWQDLCQGLSGYGRTWLDLDGNKHCYFT